jgi:hypothetical protein
VKKNSSPYDLLPANDNPTRRLLTELIDFNRLRSQQAPCSAKATLRRPGAAAYCVSAFGDALPIMSASKVTGIFLEAHLPRHGNR